MNFMPSVVRTERFRRSLYQTLRLAVYYRKHPDKWEKKDELRAEPAPSGRIEGGLRSRGAFRATGQQGEPLISIITPSYNSAKTIERTILSVVEQTYRNVEFIVVDGGSTDGTLDILRKYDARITYWLSEPDNGIYDAMNKGISLAGGEWLYFLGSDDWLYDKDCLKRVFHKDRPGISLVYGNAIFFDEERGRSREFHSYFGWKSYLWSTINHQAAFYRSNLFQDFRYKTRFKVIGDTELNFKIFAQKIPCLYVDEFVAFCGTEGISSVGRNRYQNVLDGFLMRNQYIGFVKNLVLLAIDLLDCLVREVRPKKHRMDNAHAQGD